MNDACHELALDRLHAAFSLYAAGLWGALSLSAGLIALPLVQRRLNICRYLACAALAAAIAWCRIRLRRHTPAEILVGTAVGLVAAGSFVILGTRT